MTACDYILPISTAYVLGGSQYEPYDTDCSGMVTAALWHVYGIEPPEYRAWTGSMWASPDSEIIYQGTSPGLPWNKMQVDDLIFTGIYSPAFDTVDGSHVGFYTGNPEAPFLSHFCDGGPMVTAVNGVYGGRERYFGVKRMKGLDMTPDEHNLLVEVHNQLTRIDTAGHEDVPFGHDFLGRILDIQKQVNNGLASWAYKNEAMNGPDDVYQVLTDIRETQIKMLNVLDCMDKHLSGERID